MLLIASILVLFTVSIIIIYKLTQETHGYKNPTNPTNPSNPTNPVSIKWINVIDQNLGGTTYVPAGRFTTAGIAENTFFERTVKSPDGLSISNIQNVKPNSKGVYTFRLTFSGYDDATKNNQSPPPIIWTQTNPLTAMVSTSVNIISGPPNMVFFNGLYSYSKVFSGTTMSGMRAETMLLTGDGRNTNDTWLYYSAILFGLLTTDPNSMNGRVISYAHITSDGTKTILHTAERTTLDYTTDNIV